MLLDGKVAIIYGGSGSIGGATARAFAGAGAKVHLVARTRERLDAVADGIRADGGMADVAVVDALDEAAVDAHAATVVAADGRIDVSFNVINHNDVQGTPLVEMAVDDVMAPVDTAMRTTLITASAAANRAMIGQGSGVILMFGGYGDPMRGYSLGGLQIAFQALDTLRNQLAAELGSHGIRVLTLQTGGIPESIPADFAPRDEITAQISGATMLGRAATLADVANAATFAASDLAASMTACALNLTAGTTVH